MGSNLTTDYIVTMSAARKIIDELRGQQEDELMNMMSRFVKATERRHALHGVLTLSTAQAVRLGAASPTFMGVRKSRRSKEFTEEDGKIAADWADEIIRQHQRKEKR